jgi:hypothetical protein
VAINRYVDFVIQAENIAREDGGVLRFQVRVASSPAGSTAAETRWIPANLREDLWHLEYCAFVLDDMIARGEMLAGLLLPGACAALLSDSLNALGSDQGLRLRLRLPPELAFIPWEYLYIRPEGGDRDLTGFLALDRRISIARQETPSMPRKRPVVKTYRLAVAQADPQEEGWSSLVAKLAQERANIESVLKDSAIRPHFIVPATMDGIEDALLSGAEMLHVSGHGVFQRTFIVNAGSVVSEGEIMLVNDQGRAEPVSASRLELNLRGRDVDLTVLAACESRQDRDREVFIAAVVPVPVDYNVASSMVAAVARAGIPAVVGLQATLLDQNYAAFGKSFYRTLAKGLPVDQAVSDGRLAILNLGGANDRDWGVPVLYLQTDADVAFTPSVEPDAGVPEVQSTDPTNGKLDVPRDLRAIRIKFDRPMQSAGYSLKSPPHFGREQADVRMDSDTCTLTRRNGYRLLPPNAVFEFTVNPPEDGPATGFRDLNGNRASKFEFRFTTGTQPDKVTGAENVDEVALRKAMVKRFGPPASLDTVCQVAEQLLKESGIQLQVNVALFGGSTLETQAVNLIRYLDSRGYLPYLLAALYEEAPEIQW